MTWNGAHLLPDCLDAVLPEGAPVLVVDNASTDGTAELLSRDYPSVQVEQLPRNTGFAGGVAHALDVVRTPYTVLLNNDAVVRPGWLAALLEPFDDPRTAAVCSKLLLPDGRVNSAGGFIEANGYAHDLGFGQPDDGRWDTPREVAFATGTAAAFRTDAACEVGGVDPRYFLYVEDVDLSWRLQLAGWTVRYQPTALVVHQHSATAGEFSLLHTFHSERNRLATLVTNATPGTAAAAVLRFPLTTLSVAVGESRAKAAARVKAYLSFLRWLPALMRRRRAVTVVVSRAEVEARFAKLRS